MRDFITNYFNFKIIYNQRGSYHISFHFNYLTKVNRSSTMILQIDAELIKRWNFIDIDFKKYNIHRPKHQKNILFETKEMAQKFMDEYLFPQMIASNLINPEFKFKIGEM